MAAFEASVWTLTGMDPSNADWKSGMISTGALVRLYLMVLKACYASSFANHASLDAGTNASSVVSFCSTLILSVLL